MVKNHCSLCRHFVRKNPPTKAGPMLLQLFKRICPCSTEICLFLKRVVVIFAPTGSPNVRPAKILKRIQRVWGFFVCPPDLGFPKSAEISGVSIKFDIMINGNKVGTRPYSQVDRP